VYSDGVTNKSFSVIPKHSEDSMSAASLYKKCLFRVEIAMENEFSLLDFDLRTKLKQFEREREEADDGNASEIT
jgi:hypothetical protein